MKCIFLLTLATGNRLSETHALRRGETHVNFNGDGSATLWPDPRFLAKNEKPQNRRKPIILQPLRKEGSAPHLLCPIQALKTYLHKTANAPDGPLFINPATQEPCSKNRVRSLLVKLIKLSQPEAKPQFHDVRKVSSSLAFFNGMNVQELCDRVGWASIRVFRKHYLKEIKDVSSPCVAVSSVVHRGDLS